MQKETGLQMEKDQTKSANGKKNKQNVQMVKDKKNQHWEKNHTDIVLGSQLRTLYFLKLLFFCLLCWPSSPIKLEKLSDGMTDKTCHHWNAQRETQNT